MLRKVSKLSTGQQAGTNTWSKDGQTVKAALEFLSIMVIMLRNVLSKECVFFFISSNCCIYRNNFFLVQFYKVVVHFFCRENWPSFTFLFVMGEAPGVSVSFKKSFGLFF